MEINKKFIVIGGGTGTYSVLSGLKKYTDKICAIVTMADSGGSAKKERDEWGLLPSSDIRKSLLALSNVSTRDLLLLRRLFQYRYSEGTGVAGMSFGNLFLVALTKLLGSQAKAIEKAGEILKIRGQVLPVTLERADLVASYNDGSTVIGEHAIDDPTHNGKLKIVKLTTHPITHITAEAKTATQDSDCIIIGPGGFYTTIIANLVVKGVLTAIRNSSAIKIFIMNLMTEYGQTYNFTAKLFIKELDKYFPIKYLDYVFINNAPIPASILKRYRRVHAVPVANNLQNNAPYKIISSDLLSLKAIRHEKGDLLKRSLIRHDPEKISSMCMKVMNLI